MKTVFKTLTAIAAITLVSACAVYAGDQTAPQAWTPGWRHEQMVKAVQDGTVTPGPGPGYMRRGGGGPGYGPGYGRGMMGRGPAFALDANGKIDPTKLPEGCPMRTALESTTPTK